MSIIEYTIQNRYYDKYFDFEMFLENFLLHCRLKNEVNERHIRKTAMNNNTVRTEPCKEKHVCVNKLQALAYPASS